MRLMGALYLAGLAATVAGASSAMDAVTGYYDGQAQITSELARQAETEIMTPGAREPICRDCAAQKAWEAVAPQHQRHSRAAATTDFPSPTPPRRWR